MKAYCCEQRLATITEDVAYFTKRCGVCGMTYTQNKRQPKLVTQSKPFDQNATDIALILGRLDGLTARVSMMSAHVENLIQRVYELEGGDGV